MNILFKCLLILFSILASVTTVHADTKIVYVVSDYRGDVIYQSNNSGGIVRDSAYNPYGEDNTLPALQSGSDVGFAGLTKDADMKLVFAGARYYDAEIHRFIEPDPEDALDHIADNTMLFNRYAYANNNPYKYIDPDGRLPFLIPLAIFIAKEIAAEGLSQATGGASDFLSVRRMGTKVGKFSANKLSEAIRDANKDIAARQSNTIAEKTVDKWSRHPTSLQDEMVLQAAKEGQGRIIFEKLNDPMFKGMEKLHLKETSKGGKTTVVHYVRDPKTGELMDFKFKQHSDDSANLKPWGNDPAVLPSIQDH